VLPLTFALALIAGPWSAQSSDTSEFVLSEDCPELFDDTNEECQSVQAFQAAMWTAMFGDDYVDGESFWALGDIIDEPKVDIYSNSHGQPYVLTISKIEPMTSWEELDLSEEALAMVVEEEFTVNHVVGSMASFPDGEEIPFKGIVLKTIHELGPVVSWVRPLADTSIPEEVTPDPIAGGLQTKALDINASDFECPNTDDVCPPGTSLSSGQAQMCADGVCDTYENDAQEAYTTYLDRVDEINEELDAARVECTSEFHGGFVDNALDFGLSILSFGLHGYKEYREREAEYQECRELAWNNALSAQADNRATYDESIASHQSDFLTGTGSCCEEDTSPVIVLGPITGTCGYSPQAETCGGYCPPSETCQVVETRGGDACGCVKDR
jgi:hypothetical protein